MHKTQKEIFIDTQDPLPIKQQSLDSRPIFNLQKHPIKMNVNKIIPSLIEALETNDLVLVTFTTKAGSTRVMGCTTMLDAIPEDQHEGRFDSRLNHDSIVCVYDFQNSGWRSFRKDSVVSFQTL